MSNDKSVLPEPLSELENSQDLIQLDKFAWIIDENLLRDEGVLYGISDSEPAEKIQTIEHYFNEQIAEKKVQIALTELDQDQCRDKITAGMEELDQLKNRLKFLSTELSVKDHTFYRTCVGFFSYFIMVSFNFWLVYEHLTPYWKYPLLIALGVYFFGSLSLFNKHSFIYSNFEKLKTDPHPWRTITEELIIPLIATIFILSWSKADIGWGKLVASFLVIYTIFVFSGKALLGYLLELPKDYRTMKQNRLVNRFNEIEKAEVKKQIEKTESANTDAHTILDKLSAEKKR